MKVLVVGGGGREHTLVWKINKSPLVKKIYCAPGNGGIASIAECVDIKDIDITGLVEFAKKNEIDLTVIGPDDPLMMGIVDEFEKEGLRVFGPNSKAARIEGSKSFSKELMKKYYIPTAEYEIFNDSEAAINYLDTVNYPIVIKADGLAKGKGVIIAQDYQQAVETVNNIMVKKVFGESGNKVVIEEFLEGQEISVLSFTDGKTIVPMKSAQDHKKVYDNDKGLNTGGMGAFSPSSIYTPEVEKYCIENIFNPTIKAMQQEGCEFKGVLYFGLIMTANGVKVIEYNSRFGDPEAQVVLPCLQTDIIEIFNAVIDQKLSNINIKWDDSVAVCVIMASGGYPETYKTGYSITGLCDVEKDKDTIVFHAGTQIINGKTVTSGGRVLGVTAVGKNLDAAIKKAYKGIDRIKFKDVHFRRDIGKQSS